MAGDHGQIGALSDQHAAIAMIGAFNGSRRRFAIGLNTGLTEAQLRGLVQVLRHEVGSQQAGNAGRILDGSSATAEMEIPCQFPARPSVRRC